MSIGTLSDEKVKEFGKALRGRIVLRGDADYDSARAIWNGMIDKRPAIIAQCADAGDVMAAVAFARENLMPASVRGGGHSIAGNSLCDDGLVIDLSPMKHIHVDPEARTARAGGGVLWGELDKATQQHGLAVTGGLISTTGIAGLTLGGGMGWLERKFGLTCDSLIAADVVTADSRLLHASADEHADLFWALRGGGGNFGVVTDFTYRLHQLGPTILGGMMIWPFAEAERILKSFREFTADLDDGLTTMFSTVTAPRAPFVPQELQGRRCVALIGCYAGAVEDGHGAIEPMRQLAPAADMWTAMPYTSVQSMLDPLHPAGLRNYWKSEYLGSVSDEVIGVLLDRFSNVPSVMTHVDIHHLEGEYGRIGTDETAFSHRDARYIVNIVGTWTTAGDDERNIEWTRDLWNGIRPHSLGATYLNFAANEGEDRVRAAYGDAKYRRLAEIKREYDPTNFFCRNQNIKPAG